MMEQGENTHTKPALPEKPKTIPPPTKVSNPLVSSITAAVKKGALHTPRVVFKDDKSLSRQLSPTSGSKEVNTPKLNLKDKNLPLVLPVSPKKADDPELESSQLSPVSASLIKVTTPKMFIFNPLKSNKDECDKTDVKEADIAKKPMKDRNLPLVLPVASRKAETPEAEPSPAKVSTPKSFVFTPQKTSKDENEKADPVKEVDASKQSLKENKIPMVLPVTPIKADVPEPSPVTPVCISPVKMSTPKSFVFNTPRINNNDKENKDTVDSPIPASCTPASSLSAPAGPSAAVNPPTQSVPAIPKTVVPSQTPPVPNIPASSFPTSASPEPKIPEPTIPVPAIPTQAVAKSETPKPEISVPALSNTGPLKPNINLLNLTEVFPPPEGTPPPDFTDIPPPVFEDFPDGDFSEEDLPPEILTSITPVSTSPNIFRLASPTPSTPPVVSPDPLATPGPDSVTVSSPPPVVHTVPTAVDKVLENTKKMATNPESTEEDQTKPLSALSALARAEEMASVKRAPQDSRIFNLLERAKRKSTVPTTPNTTTPETTTPTDIDTPQIPLSETLTPWSETATTEVTQPDLAPPVKDLPQLPTIVQAQPEEPPPVPEVLKIPELPPVDYVDHGHLQSDTHPREPTKVNGLDHRTLTVVKPLHPPPPPPRKILPATPVADPPLQKPTQSPPRDLHTPTTPSEHLETHNSLLENSFGEVFYEDLTEPEASPVSTFRPPSIPSSNLSPRRPISVHEEAFLKQLKPKPQDVLPNMEEVGNGSVNSASLNPETPAAVLQDSVRSSPALSPSGTLERVNSSLDEQVETKKGKTLKNKKLKGPPKNPYADTPAVAPETPKKSLFSRKNSAKVTEDKELKKKEKQREKEKEKEKEREKKEQKEKEKKENEMRKKFKITGQEEPIYHVKVIEDCKGRKNDLPVKVGDTVSIIRIENCPKGKWLAKDSNNKYGYVPVESMDLNINGIRELGKMTTASNRSSGNGHKDTEIISTGSRTSEHYDMNHESFSEDSDEWTCDEDDPVFGSANETAHVGLDQSLTTPDQDPIQENPSDLLYENVQRKQEAVQRLSTFLMPSKTPSQQSDSPIESKMPEPKTAHEEDPANLNKEDDSDVQILPPPDLYADIIDSMPIYSKPIKLVSK